MCCSVYERAFNNLRDTQPDAKEEAVMLLEAWRKFEQQAQATADQQKSSAVAAVEKRMPKRIKRKRPIETEDGSNAGMEVGSLLCILDHGHAPEASLSIAMLTTRQCSQRGSRK